MNISEAIESGRRYNRAIRQSHWESQVYLYDNDGNLFLNSPDCLDIHGKKYDPHTSCLDLETCWELSNDAPWSGPAGVITRERTEAMLEQAFEKVDYLAACEDTTPQRCDYLKAAVDVVMTLGNSTIAFTENEAETNWNQK